MWLTYRERQGGDAPQVADFNAAQLDHFSKCGLQELESEEENDDESQEIQTIMDFKEWDSWIETCEEVLRLMRNAETGAPLLYVMRKT